MTLSLDLNTDFIDRQYRLWRQDPAAVSEQWRFFFEGFTIGSGPAEPAPAAVLDRDMLVKHLQVAELIHRYRDLGHLLACLDPLTACPTDHPLLSLEAFQLTPDDLDREFSIPGFGSGKPVALRDLIALLRETYGRGLGVEYLHVQDPDERRWLQERMESTRNRPQLDAETRLRILNKLCQATLFEQFVHAKYLGQKRFSLEGAESAVVFLDLLLDHAARAGCREAVLAMAHRGRLNVQVNVLDKPYEAVFCSFEDSYNPDALVGSGDVKYHQGYYTELATRHGRPLAVLMPSNASHLESVDPIAEGIVRRRQELFGAAGSDRVVPILVHGDAAFAGQGVVFETLNLSQLEGYRTGGTIHLIINNQIGFTALPEDVRSTRYSTDVAKMLMVPIFHVHGEAPEAVAAVARLAFDYRARFHKDVVIDLVAYRRYGHNEGDEPAYTQPQLYERIRRRPPVHDLYADQCLSAGLISPDQLNAIKSAIQTCLEHALEAARGATCRPPEAHFHDLGNPPAGTGTGTDADADVTDRTVTTAVSKDRLLEIAATLFTAKPGFTIHRKLERILLRRLETVRAGAGIDWSNAELLAFGSLVTEGTPVRLSGQDSRRGTFSQRHSVLTDAVSGAHDTPLNRLAPDQAPFQVFDSALSENAVLGFEYGYSLTAPESLVLWEAQFGDFANNAQVIIDQYIAAAEAKWRRPSALALLLPHGFEGQGPEHSSARLERYLQLCAEDNLQVCVPSTPAQYFHLLRRQAKQGKPKPLIVLTPKSLLRHPLAVSRLDELIDGAFQPVITDPEPPPKVRRLLWCSGKIYYDLLARRREQSEPDAAIVRIEQLYPLRPEQLQAAAARFPTAEEFCWVQEEPRNMGAWRHVSELFAQVFDRPLRYLGRPPAASPATGYAHVHKAEQGKILDAALHQVVQDP